MLLSVVILKRSRIVFYYATFIFTVKKYFTYLRIISFVLAIIISYIKKTLCILTFDFTDKIFSKWLVATRVKKFFV